MGTLLLQLLRDARSPHVREIRGAGLMLGLELRGRVGPVIQRLQERGILALVAGKTVLRLLPPLILTESEAEQLARGVLEVLDHANA